MRYLKAKDIAEMFDIPVRRARGLMRAEDMPTVRIGGTLYIEESKLQKYLDERKQVNLAKY